MGREARRVPSDWQHPKGARDRYRPLWNGAELIAKQAAWDRQKAQWDAGFYEGMPGEWKPREADMQYPFEEWDGKRPDPADHMPVWTEAEATHYQMYETTTEGTPISPVFASPEELARWLFDNRTSAFGDMTETYELWLQVCQGASARR